MNVRLIAAQDRHFAWMLGECAAPAGLRLPPGGVEDPGTLTMLRTLCRDLRRAACRACWLVVSGGEVVGVCGFLTAPDGEGMAKFGYTIAESRRNLGYGSAAVAALIDKAARNPTLCTLAADTMAGNVISQRVLSKNGFVRVGTCFDAEDGLLVMWRRPLRRWHLPHPQVLADLVGRLRKRGLVPPLAHS